MTDLINARTLWYTESCQTGCCDCCNIGYCPADDTQNDGRWDMPLLTGTINGIDYYGNSYTLIRRDRIDPDTIPDIEPSNLNYRADAMPWMNIPTLPLPGLSEEPCPAYLLDRQTRAGLTRHTHTGHYVHLYEGNDHVGWSTLSVSSNLRGITPDQYDKIKQVADLTNLDVDTVARVLNAANTPSATSEDTHA